jgi:uncharacterized protein
MTNPPSKRATVKRLPQRGVYDRETINNILDEGLICHVGISDAGETFVIPTIYVRISDKIYVHGSPASRMLRAVASGVETCVVVTLVDGLVLARSAFHHSMNYRSVVLFGTGAAVEEEAEKIAVLQALSDHLIPGRWNDIRRPTREELRKTAVVSIPIEEASAKVRSGPPLDDEPDYDLPIWAGVIPLRLSPGEVISDPRLKAGIVPPNYARDYPGPR